MKIQINDTTRVIKKDSYNWCIEEYKSKKKDDVVLDPEWVQVPNKFFNNAQLAIKHAVLDGTTNIDTSISVEKFEEWLMGEIDKTLDKLGLIKGDSDE